MEKIKLGILGVGNIGRDHVKRIVEGRCPEIALCAVCDPKQARLDYAREIAGEDVPLFRRAEEMMESGLIDSVLVSVPHYDHPKFAMMAMEKGLHVLIEKPAGVYTKQVLEMNECAKKHNVKFGIMMNQRTNCVYRKMREIVQSGELGEIRRTNWIITDWYRSQAYYDSGDWRATWSGEGGGVLLNQCPHNLDLWQWICGMPKKVLTKMHFGKWHDIEVEDDVTTYVEYENGATGTFITTTGDAPGTNRFEVVCDGGTLVTDGNSIVLKRLDMPESEFTKVNTAPFGSPRVTVENPETDGKNDQHVGVLNAFVGAILDGTPLIADGREGIFGLTISNAMHLSAWLGKEIELPFDEALFKELLFERVKTSRRKENVTAVLADTEGSYNAGN